jgi:hypothetical protein
MCVCVCMYVCMYTAAGLSLGVQEGNSYICVCVCMYVCMYTAAGLSLGVQEGMYVCMCIKPTTYIHKYQLNPLYLYDKHLLNPPYRARVRRMWRS